VTRVGCSSAKWDGVRCIAYRSDDGAVRMRTRNDLPRERTYPEIADALAALQRAAHRQTGARGSA